ncbi:MAG: DUF1150 family protein [Stellaceae bacterium]
MTATERWKQIPTQEFVALGMQNLAYIKQVTVDERAAFAIHAADGTLMAVMDSRDLAEAAMRQHELEPLSVH